MNERTRLIKIYLSHFIRKGWCWLCVRDGLETGTDCYILTQSSSDHSSTSFSFWLDCPTVDHWGLKLCLELVLTPRASYLQLRLELNSNWLELTHWLELTQAVCGTWYYNCLTSTLFLWAYSSAPNSTTSTGQGDIPIPSTGGTCFVSWLTARSRVNM